MTSKINDSVTIVKIPIPCTLEHFWSSISKFYCSELLDTKESIIEVSYDTDDEVDGIELKCIFNDGGQVESK